LNGNLVLIGKARKEELICPPQSTANWVDREYKPEEPPFDAFTLSGVPVLPTKVRKQKPFIFGDAIYHVYY